MPSIRSICVYCGSSPGNEPAYLQSGSVLGQALADAGIRLVYGGGTRGIMGAVSAAAIENGGAVTGIIPSFLVRKEAADGMPAGLDELLEVETMHERKHLMFEKADAFVALPGGLGTVEEVIEIMTWAQLGRHRKPIVFANVAGFWEPMRVLLDHMTQAGFVHTAHQVRPLFIDDVREIVPTLLRVAEPALADGDEAVIARL